MSAKEIFAYIESLPLAYGIKVFLISFVMITSLWIAWALLDGQKKQDLKIYVFYNIQYYVLLTFVALVIMFVQPKSKESDAMVDSNDKTTFADKGINSHISMSYVEAVNLGYDYTKKGIYGKALELLLHATSINPRGWEAPYNLAILYHLKGGVENVSKIKGYLMTAKENGMETVRLKQDKDLELFVSQNRSFIQELTK